MSVELSMTYEDKDKKAFNKELDKHKPSMVIPILLKWMTSKSVRVPDLRKFLGV